MVHEAMVLEYSGRHLAMIELAASVKLLLYLSLIGCIFLPWTLAGPDAPPASYIAGFCFYLGKLGVLGRELRQYFIHRFTLFDLFQVAL
jgi:formate hydrogenlyase subunit 4